MISQVHGEDEMIALGTRLGVLLFGGEIIELIGDVGAGKTTLSKGIALGLEVEEVVLSPSFTISRVYNGRDGLVLAHYDFYRLVDAGIMADELSETVSDPKTVTIIEWGGVVEGVLPIDRLTIRIESPTENSRRLSIVPGGPISKKLEAKL
ncbi:MAG: tRNA (adenosine(37)-N6)-threonylcarbamoyltransferase complex ATPase subunit type 1 TsaE [Candidatus Saccharibacteria bacterium]